MNAVSLDQVVAHLAATSLFANLPRRALLALAPVVQQVEHAAGAIIAAQGRVDATLWIVIDGMVSFQQQSPDGGQVHQGMSGYGTVIGSRGVFADEPRDSTALSFDRVRLLVLDGEVLWEILRSDAQLLDLLVLPDELRERLRVPSGGRGPGGERTITIFRRHPLTVLPGLVGFPLMVFLGSAGLVWLVASAGVLGPSALAALAGLALLATGAAATYAFYDYWHDCLVVTNRRVMNVERKPWIDERRSAARLDRVQDVRFVQPSLMARLLDYGDIFVQTAGARGKLGFDRVRHPRQARDLIFEQVGRARDRAGSERQVMIARKVLGAMGHGSTPGDEPLRVASQADVAQVQRPGLLLRAFRYLLPAARTEAPDGTITFRKHWWSLLRDGWLPIGLWLLATGALLAALVGSGPLAGPLAAGGLLLWLGLLAWAWWVFEDWRNDLYVVTRELVIDINRRPLGIFAEQRQAPLGQVQDVRFVIPNPLAAILRFGDVIIETAAESGSFTFDSVRNPQAVQDEIFLRLDQRLAAIQRAEQDKRDEELVRWISAYHQITSANPEDPKVGDRSADWLRRGP
ncbi:MAG TPA: PH domain-containing protein [Anaerolineae bacterium]|nr:PH domain-containing protein [Anaerolineae bacterium]HRA19134.1 PH domain-containing protein [Anaerolineae bacterium]